MIENLRPAWFGEASALADIGFAAWGTGRLGLLDAGRADRSALREAFFEFCRDAILVAAEEDRLLGWGGREHRDDYISDLWVSPSAQRRGVGGALLGRMEADIASADYGFAKLPTHAANVDAIRFYQRHGYALAARVREFSAPLGCEIDKESPPGKTIVQTIGPGERGQRKKPE